MREPLSKGEIEDGFEWWYIRSYKHKELNEAVVSFLQVPARIGWLKSAREALFLSSYKLAAKAGLHASSWSRYEKLELTGNVTLKDMEKCAQAMGCEFVYAIRPKGHLCFSQAVWSQIFPAIKSHNSLRRAIPGGRGRRISALASDQMYKPAFRKAVGWARNSDPAAWEMRLFARALRR